MRTNIVLDDDLIQEAMRLSGSKTKREVVALALREYVTNRKRLNLLELDGAVQFREDYDHKRLREGR